MIATAVISVMPAAGERPTTGKRMRPIGIFGGTFDPVHYGHLRPALEVMEALELEELRLIPGRVPPHRGAPGASPEARLAMLRLAVADQPGFVVDEREMARAGPSYSVDTLSSLRIEYGPERPLCLIVGLDAFLGLGSWHRWEEIPKLAHIVVTHRPGWQLEPHTVPGARDALALLERARLESRQALASAPAGGVWLEAVTQLEISATDVRRRRRAGRSIRYLLPDAVRRYIDENELYEA